VRYCYVRKWSICSVQNVAGPFKLCGISSKTEENALVTLTYLPTYSLHSATSLLKR
jgi:hypothetical protein